MEGSAPPVWVQHLLWIMGQPGFWLALAVHIAVIVGAVIFGLRTFRREGRARLAYGTAFLLLTSLILWRIVTFAPLYQCFVRGGPA